MIRCRTERFVMVVVVLALVGGVHGVNASCPPNGCESECKEHDRWCSSGHTFKYWTSISVTETKDVAQTGCIQDGFGDGGNPSSTVQVWEVEWDNCKEDCDPADLTTGDKETGAKKLDEGLVGKYTVCTGT